MGKLRLQCKERGEAFSVLKRLRAGNGYSTARYRIDGPVVYTRKVPTFVLAGTASHLPRGHYEILPGWG